MGSTSRWLLVAALGLGLAVLLWRAAGVPGSGEMLTVGPEGRALQPCGSACSGCMPSLLRRHVRRLQWRLATEVREPERPTMAGKGLQVTTILTGLTTPIALARLGAGDWLVLERTTGRVRRVSAGGRVVGTVLDLAVNSYGERGALGIASHPGFPQPPYVYVYWTWIGWGEGANGLEGPDDVEARAVDPMGNRLDRFIWNGTRLIFDRNLLRLPARTHSAYGRVRGDHNGGVIRWGPDGKLYTVIGDQNLRGWLQNVRNGFPPTDGRLAGVILRLNEDGSTPTDNPFYRYGAEIGGEVGRNLQRIYAYGIRNSFGMAFDPDSGFLWMSENGDNTFDEVNIVPPGFNSRWVQIMGPDGCFEAFRDHEGETSDGLDTPEFTPADLAPTVEEAKRRLYQLPGSRPLEPLFAWRYPVAPTAVAFVHQAPPGHELRDAVLVADLLGRIYRFRLRADRRGLVFADRRLADGVDDNWRDFRLRESDSLVVGRGFGLITDMQPGPSGDLYVVSMTQGAIYRITR